MNKRYKLGVIGIGDISRAYLQNLQEYGAIVELYACAARNYERTKEKAAQYGFQKVYRTAEALLADPEVEIVLNLTIPEVHAKYNRLALLAGKHVYSEKPLAADFEAGQALVALAKENKLLLGCAPDTFLGSRLQTCKEMIQNGVIGSVVAATAFMLSHGYEEFKEAPDFYYQRGAGPVMDLGPYYLRAFSLLLGPVRRVLAMSQKTFPEREVILGPEKGRKIPVEVDTFASVLLEYDCGAIVTMILTMDVLESSLPKMELYGTKGTICFPDQDPYDGPNLFGGEILLRECEDLRWRQLPRTDEDLARDWKLIKSTRPFDSVVHERNSRGIGLIDMIYAIDEGRPCRANGEMALHELEVMDKIFKASKSGCAQEVFTRFEVPPILGLNELTAEGL